MLKAIILFVLCLLLPLTTLFADSPTLSRDPIKIGWIGPLSGCCSVTGVDSVKAVQMVFDQVNSTGGINGHPLILKVEDDRYETNLSISH